MKLGIGIPPFYPSALVETAVEAAESVDADSLWMPDHLLGVFHPAIYGEIGLAELLPDPDGFFDPFCLGAWLGRRTDLPLGVAVTDSIRRAAPDVARSALTLHHLCEGGFNLGIGSGEAENLLPFGYSFDRPVATTERFLAILRHLVDTGQMPEGVGRLGLPLHSAAGKMKIWIAAHRPRMLRLTGQYGDGWLPANTTTPAEYRKCKATIADHARAAGRPEPESGLSTFVMLGESRDGIRDMLDAQPMAKLFAVYMAPASAWSRYGLDSPAGAQCRGYIDVIPHELDPAVLREFASRIPFELLEEYIFLGNADDIAGRLEALAAAGCEHMVITNLTGLAGGLSEAMAHNEEFSRLCQAIRAT